jgi:hypothetical protein
VIRLPVAQRSTSDPQPDEIELDGIERLGPYDIGAA